jgi:hypothetical protein
MSSPKLHNKPLNKLLHDGHKVVAREVLYAVYATIHRRISRTQRCKEDHEKWLLATEDWRVLPQRKGLKELAESPKTRYECPIKIQTLSGDVYELYNDAIPGSSLTSDLGRLERAIANKICKSSDFELLWQGQLVTSGVFLTNRSLFWGSTLQIVYRDD